MSQGNPEPPYAEQAEGPPPLPPTIYIHQRYRTDSNEIAKGILKGWLMITGIGAAVILTIIILGVTFFFGCFAAIFSGVAHSIPAPPPPTWTPPTPPHP
jgi:hypothetical protein